MASKNGNGLQVTLSIEDIRFIEHLLCCYCFAMCKFKIGNKLDKAWKLKSLFEILDDGFSNPLG